MASLFVVKDPGLITASSVGLAIAPTLAATGGLVSDDGTMGAFLKHTTGSQAVGSGGIVSGFEAIQLQLLNDVTFSVRLDATTFSGNYGYWIGMFSVRPDAIGISDPSTGDYAAFRILEDGGIQTVTRNSQTGLTLMQPMPPASAAPGMIETFTITATTPTSIDFDYASALIHPYTTHSEAARIPAGDTHMAFGALVITSAAVDRHVAWSSVELNRK